jgi:DDE superfamily endonuclease
MLVEIPWAARVWASPFLCALAPSERYAAKRGKRHKRITEWAWQLLLVLRRWYPEREIVVIADRAYASLKLLDRCRKSRRPITSVSRLRLDATLYEPAPPRRPGQRGSPFPRVDVCSARSSLAASTKENQNIYRKDKGSQTLLARKWCRLVLDTYLYTREQRRST